VLLTGATGALGPAAIRSLVAGGFEVRALTRSPGPAEVAGVEHAVGDLADRASLERAVEGMDVVVHLAALLHIVNPPQELRAEYRRINVEGTQSLADAAARAGVRRFVLASTTAVYGSTSAPATESTPPAPDSWYAESKLAAEQTVLGAHRSDAFDVTVLRLSAVYGPRIKGNYERLLRALAAGRFVPVGPGTNRRSLIHEDDAAAALVVAAQHPSARGRLFNVADTRSHELRSIIAAMCQALGRAEPRVSLPAGATMVGAQVIEGLARLIGRRPPITRAALSKYLESSVVDASHISRELGFTVRVELVDGWRATVEAMRATGLLPRTGGH